MVMFCMTLVLYIDYSNKVENVQFEAIHITPDSNYNIHTNLNHFMQSQVRENSFSIENQIKSTLREESSQTNVILHYKLLAAILSAVCSVIQQSQYVLHFYYTLYDGKYDCKTITHKTIFQLQCFVLLNNTTVILQNLF